MQHFEISQVSVSPFQNIKNHHLSTAKQIPLSVMSQKNAEEFFSQIYLL